MTCKSCFVNAPITKVFDDASKNHYNLTKLNLSCIQYYIFFDHNKNIIVITYLLLNRCIHSCILNIFENKSHPHLRLMPRWPRSNYFRR